MIFDHASTELPIATARSRAPGAWVHTLVRDLRGWLHARWSWFRPRLVPMVVAAASLVVLVLSAETLARGQVTRPSRATSHRIVIVQDGVATVRIVR